MAMVSVRIEGANLHYRDFDRRAVRKGMRKVGSDVRKIARKMVARRAVSRPGEPPGKDSGVLQKSVRAKVSRSGFSVSVYPNKTAEMGDVFYPAFVIYGHRAPYSETAMEARSHKKRSGKKVAAPRANFVVEAGLQYEAPFQKIMAEVLADAILPGYLS